MVRNPLAPSRGMLAQAMAACASARGVDIRLGAAVREVILEGDRAVGAVTESGERFYASAVVSKDSVSRPADLRSALFLPLQTTKRPPSTRASWPACRVFSATTRPFS